MNKNWVDYVAEHSRKFNLDDLLDTITGYTPEDFKKQITRLYIFVNNAAIHSEDILDPKVIEAIDLLQQIMESMEDIENPKDSLLAVRVK